MARRVLRKHEVVKNSLDSIAEYLATEASLRVALHFLERAEEAFALILRSPRIGHLQVFRSLELEGVRAWHVRGFAKWLVYYREVEDGVEVLDVMHGAQDRDARFQENFEDEGPHSG
ncbi:MAG: type II toxin-antitoxin system RelE/ParE family toxin [Planctomycetes bacterium]|nr:type II toxin-antitoxin system RelE/ParE family toxin [Planctomycetota bacterium]